MARSTPPVPLRLEHKALVVLVALVSAAFLMVLAPFAGAVLWATFIAIVFAPLQRRMLELTGARPTLAALATLALIVLIVILPLTLLGASVVQEASLVYQKLRSGEIQLVHTLQLAMDMLPAWTHGLLERFGLGDVAALQDKATALLTRSGQIITTRLLGFGQDTLDFLVAFFIMLYLLFFLLRDGEQLAGRIAQAVPLQPRQTARLLSQFVTVVRATVKGNIAVALVQGSLGAVAFWFLGLSAPLFWGAVMAVLSLLPAVGAALVWIPVALYYVFAGDLVSAIGLALWGVLVIGLVDNVLRPLLVGKDTHMPDYLVLLATLGGIAVFGINGFVVGPVVASMFLVSWNLLTQARTRQAAPDDGYDTM
jgi:predicted PurR-regulated permease PerM